MPTSEYKDDEVEELYEMSTIIMGYWNSVDEHTSYRNIVGPRWLGRRNQRGQMLIDFCGLVITNTWFKKPKRRLYTWKAPGDQNRHQLDYILVKHRFRNSMKDMQTMPRANNDSDHNLLDAKTWTRLKKIIKFQKGKPRWDVKKLYDRQKVQDALEEKLGATERESGNV
jgi:hypothetical protein